MRRIGVLLTVIAMLFSSVLAEVKAAGNGVVISEVMTGSVASASTEFVELHNNTNTDIDISEWKLQYYSATGTSGSTKVTFSGVLEARGFALLGTDEFKTEHSLENLDFSFNPGFSDSGGRLKIVDANGDVEDSLSWGSSSTQSEGLPANSLVRGESLKRKVNGDAYFIDDNSNSSDFALSASPYPQGGDVYETEVVERQQPAVEVSEQTTPLLITEMLPNAVGSDTAGEFIELYNPNEFAVGLSGYELHIGPNFEAIVNLPGEVEIAPHQYLALYNDHPKFTLVNTTSKAKLVAPGGNIVSETPAYEDLGEGVSWANIDGVWQKTTQPTPDSGNIFVPSPLQSSDGSSELEPCGPGKFRNPETNRCKTIDDRDLSSCDPGEERNPETNRCRKIVSSDLSQCKPGYERNPSTNRCRKSGTDEDQLAPCQPGYERNPATNRCRKITASTNPNLAAANQISAINPINLSTRILLIVSAVALGYGAYEYRSDIKNFWLKFKHRNTK